MEAKDLAKEIRDHKTETDDRLATLERAVSDLTARLSELEAQPPVVNVTNNVVQPKAAAKADVAKA
ncbi:hypothetical protein [Mesorhizobium amorphae]|uniref:hypothetical protein n=1 Tax=Mesorhizobium amorphae TaxID=71433 RepID=UPI001185AA8F|nr:hypothetical protein [Mesorhizobium amorphae]